MYNRGGREPAARMDAAASLESGVSGVAAAGDRSHRAPGNEEKLRRCTCVAGSDRRAGSSPSTSARACDEIPLPRDTGFAFVCSVAGAMWILFFLEAYRVAGSATSFL